MHDMDRTTLEYGQEMSSFEAEQFEFGQGALPISQVGTTPLVTSKPPMHESVAAPMPLAAAV